MALIYILVLSTTLVAGCALCATVNVGLRPTPTSLRLAHETVVKPSFLNKTLRFANEILDLARGIVVAKHIFFNFN
jgi:hypothetical protein